MSEQPTRRTFLVGGAAALGSFALTGRIFAGRIDHDLIIRGGTVFDGTGMEGREMDVAIAGDRIVSIAPEISGRGKEEIDARGLAVSPGFIDIHSHGDGNMQADPRVESVIRQGVTTMVVGADGSSRASGAPGKTFAGLFKGIDALKPGPNVASMVGFGTIREEVIGEMDRPATADEIRRMATMVDNALNDGACGGSSGLEYTPGAFASREELTALARPLAGRRLPYATHMRNEDDRLIDAIEESIAVARGAGCPLQISHLKTQGPRNWPKLSRVFVLIDAARAARTDVAFDRYPYVAYATGLTNLFPVWSRDSGIEQFLFRVSDSSTAARIRSETLAKVELIGGWDNVQISGVRTPEDRNAEGKRLGAYSKSSGYDPYELAIGLLTRSRGDVGMLGHAMSEENLDKILSHPLGMVCSDGGGFAIDGPTRRGSPHPRGAGSFPRVLGRYVRERKALTLAQAIRKMTSQPAARVRLNDRGRIAAGMAADVVIFDPSTVTDRATFDDPFQYPAGINAVIVNGAVTLRDGQRSSTMSGRALKAS
jgi:N-acyl-D-amino-acid deacylase